MALGPGRREGGVKLKTVKGNENVADHLTKLKSKAEVEASLRKVGAEFVEQFEGSWRWAPVEEEAFICGVFST